MKIKVGSKVICRRKYGKLRYIWNMEYPRKGDILTVSCIGKHPLFNFKMLSFKELPFTLPLALRNRKTGKKNFKPIDMYHDYR
jgi:hypothetical protein